MNVEAAAILLTTRLHKFPWFLSTGVGRNLNGGDCIYLYVKTLKKSDTSFLDKGWKGFPVVIRRTGTIRPLS